MAEGLKIAFEGPDGSGKSTQCEVAEKWMVDQGLDVWRTQNSGGTEIGKELRAVSLGDAKRTAETNLYISMAMGADLAPAMDDAVAEGKHVLIDRCPLSMVAYQIFGDEIEDQKLGYEGARRMFELMDLDLLLVFTASQNVLDMRRLARTDKSTDYYEKLGPSYHDRVAKGYNRGVNWARDTKLVKRVVEIDAERSRAEIAADVRAEIEKLL